MRPETTPAIPGRFCGRCCVGAEAGPLEAFGLAAEEFRHGLCSHLALSRLSPRGCSPLGVRGLAVPSFARRAACLEHEACQHRAPAALRLLARSTCSDFRQACQKRRSLVAAGCRTFDSAPWGP